MKRFIGLILLLSVALLWGCGQETAAPTEQTLARLPVAAVQLSEPYDLPVKEGLLVNNWLLEGPPDVQITHSLPAEITCPVILVGRLSAPMENVYTLDFKWEDLPAQQAALLAQLPNEGDMNRDGVVTYAIIAPTGTDYKAACTEAMAGSKRQLLNTQVCKDEQSVAQQVAARVLASYGKDLDVLLCGSENLSLGASAAIKEAGRVTGKDLILLTVGQEIPRSSGSVYADHSAMVDAILAAVRENHSALLPLTTVVYP